MRVEFGEWLPDLQDHENPGCIVAKNCIPLIDSYTDLKGLQSFTDALSSMCLGSAWFKDSNENTFNFAGDASDLYSLTSANAWDEISSSTGAYSATTHWEFEKFGDRVIAVSDGDVPQYYDMGSSTVFANLPGTPGQASRIAVVGDFLVLGDLAADPNAIKWSGFNNTELWTPSRATQSDTQNLYGNFGKVQKIVPGDYGVIFQEHCIRRMTYVGPPTIFEIEVVEPKAGTPAPDSVVWQNNVVYYYGHDGFYVFDGRQSIPLSDNKVSRWMRDNLDRAALSQMQGVYDRQNGLVIWAFSSSGTSINNRVIIYSIKANRWSYGELNTHRISEYASTGYNLDTLTSVLGLADIDAASFNVDSAVYKGGTLNLVAFGSDHKAATLSGSALTAVIESSEIGVTGQRVFTRGVRPIVDGNAPTITVRVGSRDKLDSNVNYTLSAGLDAAGVANVRKNARFQRYEVSIAGGFDHASAVETEDRVMRGRR